MNGKKILVTGGAGDLGGQLIPQLLAAGATVVSLDPAQTKIDGVTQVQGSILDRTCVDTFTENVDLVIHIAAWHGFHEFTQSKSEAEFWDLNMTGTFNLLDACARKGVTKFLFLSSTSTDEWPGIYGMTKVLGEKLCQAFAERHSMSILSLRPRAFIPWWNTSVYPSKLDWAHWFARGAVHIDDVTQATLKGAQFLFEHDGPFFDLLEIDGKHDLTEEEKDQWRREGARTFLRKRFEHAAAAINEGGFSPEEPPSYKDIGKAQQLIGYAPSYGYAELLKEIAESSCSVEKAFSPL